MALNDDKVKSQIQHMIAFIDQEANEKAEEIDAKAEEEFNIEKGHLVQQQRVKIMEYYEKKQKQIELNKKIQVSNLHNNARLKILKAREDHIKRLLEDTQGQLVTISNDVNMYKRIVEGLISQGLFQLLEDKILIKCRKKDVQLVQEVLGNAVAGYQKVTNRHAQCTIDKENFLNDKMAGGVELSAHNGKMRVVNTLESRLALMSEQMLPELKELLFGANKNRKFHD